MTRLSSLLVATDFSASSQRAVDRAARLSIEHGAPLTVLHVVADDTPTAGWGDASVDAASLEHALGEEAKARLAELAERLRQQGCTQVGTVHTFGRVIDDVLIEASSMEADLIVMGARGEGGLRRMLLGTTAERVLRRTVRPVLIARDPAPQPYRRVLVAVDFSAWSGHAVTAARQVAPRATLVLCHTFQVPYQEKLRFAGVSEATVTHYREHTRAEATRQLHALARKAGLDDGAWVSRVEEGLAWQRIVEMRADEACDLVVLGKHGRTVAEDLLLGSVTERVIAESDGDVLVSTAHLPT